jgi:hypothetical protein
MAAHKSPGIATAVPVSSDVVTRQAMADPDDPEHDNLTEWIGTDSWDPAAFDTIEVNDRLAEIKL